MGGPCLLKAEGGKSNSAGSVARHQGHMVSLRVGNEGPPSANRESWLAGQGSWTGLCRPIVGKNVHFTQSPALGESCGRVWGAA